MAKLPALTGSIRVGTPERFLAVHRIRGRATDRQQPVTTPANSRYTRKAARDITASTYAPSVFAPLADLSASPIILCMNDWRESFRPVSCPCPAPVRMCEDHGAVSRRTLFRILGDHQPIKAWCVVCGARWPRSSAHRTARQGPNDARLPDVQSESAARV